MADLPEYPIVVLENDAPERVGKVGLFDLYMPVVGTGIVFVAAVPGTLFLAGPRFTEIVRRASNLRAATTLIHMGLIRGESLAFIREALNLTFQETADLAGVPLSTVIGWENNTIPVPLHVWTALAQRACVADGRSLPANHAICPDWSLRQIRVFPNIPSRGVAQVNQASDFQSQVLSDFQPLFPGAECFPPPRC
jgi:hypothetical protein